MPFNFERKVNFIIQLVFYGKSFKLVKNSLLTNVVTKKSIMSKLVNGQVNPSDLASVASLDRFLVLKPSDKMKRLQCCLDSDGYVIIADAECNYKYYLSLILLKKT